MNGYCVSGQRNSYLTMYVNYHKCIKLIHANSLRLVNTIEYILSLRIKRHNGIGHRPSHIGRPGHYLCISG